MGIRNAVRAGVGAVVIGGCLMAVTGGAMAAPGNSKVTICHRTASHSNPYVKVSVAVSSVDGSLGKNKGRGDHYLEHRGPVGPIASGEWGDIIPPIPGVHDGLNWNEAGIAVFDAGCSADGPAVTTTTTSTTTTTEPVPPPQP